MVKDGVTIEEGSRNRAGFMEKRCSVGMRDEYNTAFLIHDHRILAFFGRLDAPLSSFWRPLQEPSLAFPHVTDITTPLDNHVEQTFSSIVLGVDFVFKQIPALFIEISMANHLKILLVSRKLVYSHCYHVPPYRDLHRGSVQSVAWTSTSES